MAFIPLTPSPSGGRLLAGAAAAFQRTLKTWRAARTERVLSSLSYDTLKDIGYPSSLDERNTRS